MEDSILGLHHVTCIASDPQSNLDFYTHVLGLRLVKLTVNFDDPGSYHFYFGDEGGSPGTLITFFPWPGARRGRIGAGQATGIAFSIPLGSAPEWLARLSWKGIEGVEQLEDRFGEKVIGLEDPDGLKLELIEGDGDLRLGRAAGDISLESAIRGIHSVTLSEVRLERTLDLLVQTMGLRPMREEANRLRYTSGGARPGTLVDIRVANGDRPGVQGAGTVHHIAFRTPDTESQMEWQGKIASAGLNVTPVIDRTYFHSIYYHEPGGVLFEIATDPPGMTVDEPLRDLGHSLKLPPQYEAYRDRIEEALPKVNLVNENEQYVNEASAV